MRIGVFTSGGDAPGMNACIRAVVRSAVDAGHEVVGILSGYQGLLDQAFYVDVDRQVRMGPRCVSGIIRRGGTILRTSRCEEFRTEAGVRKAAEILRRHGIDALIPIGGDGTFRGATELAKHWGGPIIGCPGTIDNDLFGTDYTIGFFTAVQTAVDAVDKLRDTAESHERLFLVEVMGRHSGYIALYTALASGAEVACLPETCTQVDEILKLVIQLRQRGKQSLMIIVAEGDEYGAAQLDADLIQAGCPYSTRVATLGHVQRGGSPAPIDRILATRLGDFAVRSIVAGKTGCMAGMLGSELVLTPFAETFGQHKYAPPGFVELLSAMAN
jgi:6-phosphofructokinase 1